MKREFFTWTERESVRVCVCVWRGQCCVGNALTHWVLGGNWLVRWGPPARGGFALQTCAPWFEGLGGPEEKEATPLRGPDPLDRHGSPPGSPFLPRSTLSGWFTRFLWGCSASGFTVFVVPLPDSWSALVWCWDSLFQTSRPGLAA